MIDYAAILSMEYSQDEWTLDGNEYTGLTWLSESNKPTKKQLDDLLPVILKKIEDDKANKLKAKTALLDRLGITADEAALLLS